MSRLVDIDTLTPDERLELIGEIWNALQSTPSSIPVADELLAEIERRRSEYERDPNTASLWENVRDTITAAK